MDRGLTRLLGLLAVMAGCSGAPAPQAPTPVVPESRAGVRFDPDRLRADVYAIAADSFHGRESGTPDALRAATFIADAAKDIGLEPAGDSGFVQRFPLIAETFTAATRFTVSDSRSVTPLELGRDLAPMLSESVIAAPRRVSGELVFLGHGDSRGPSEAVDSTLWKLVHGRVAVVVQGAPASADSAERVRLESEEAFVQRLRWASSLQPAAVIVVVPSTVGGAAFYDALAVELLRPVLPAATRREGARNSSEPLAFVALASSGSPLVPADWSIDDRPRAMGRRFDAYVETSMRAVTGYNVVAKVRGTDARLRNTYVVYGAHHDGPGIVRVHAGRDSIANGADDDASGVAAVLAIARRLSRSPPARSVLFVWHGAEEKGLLGSRYFTSHPTVPIDSMVAEINADMVGRNAPRQLFVIGPRAARNGDNIALGAIVDSLNTLLPEPFDIDRSSDVEGGERAFERSDHYSYALRGIPVVLFTTGPHADYHAVGDDPRKIDYDKLARVTRLMFDVGVAVANRRTRPE